jgi:5-methylthioadenosine/S-adenosylhomocysteine deaminase
VYNATGHDVDTVVVGGRLIMHNRKLLSIDQAEVLDAAERAYRIFMERAGLASLARNPERFWGVSKS